MIAIKNKNLSKWCMQLNHACLYKKILPPSYRSFFKLEGVFSNQKYFLHDIVSSLQFLLTINDICCESDGNKDHVDLTYTL